MKAPIYSREGKKKGEVVLNPEIFAARVNARLLELIRNAYSANLRRGTADTKVRKEVSGGGKKPWKQKGTGRARHGSTRSPIWRGGGTVFGPHPRNYYVAMPRTMRRQALVSALSLKGVQKNIFLLEDFKLEAPKTKEWAEIVKSLPLEGKRALCVVREIEPNLARASQNMLNLIEICEAKNVNAYDILQREKLILEENAVAIIESRINAVAAGKSSQDSAEEKAGEAKSEKKAVRVTAKKATGKTTKAKAEKAASKGKKKS
jgi:large subunit ribosomal protein L4